jgi:hypothetical protein
MEEVYQELYDLYLSKPPYPCDEEDCEICKGDEEDEKLICAYCDHLTDCNDRNITTTQCDRFRHRN